MMKMPLRISICCGNWPNGLRMHHFFGTVFIVLYKEIYSIYSAGKRTRGVYLEISFTGLLKFFTVYKTYFCQHKL